MVSGRILNSQSPFHALQVNVWETTGTAVSLWLRQQILSHQPLPRRDLAKNQRAQQLRLHLNSHMNPHVSFHFTNGNTGSERYRHLWTLTQLESGSCMVNLQLSKTKPVLLSAFQAPPHRLAPGGGRIKLKSCWCKSRGDMTMEGEFWKPLRLDALWFPLWSDASLKKLIQRFCSSHSMELNNWASEAGTYLDTKRNQWPKRPQIYRLKPSAQSPFQKTSYCAFTNNSSASIWPGKISFSMKREKEHLF